MALTRKKIITNVSIFLLCFTLLVAFVILAFAVGEINI